MKPRLIFPILTALAVLLAGPACAIVSLPEFVRGSGNLTTETRAVSDFDEVSVSSGMRLELTQGNEESLEIEAEDNLLEYIDPTVSGEKLTVEFRNGVSINTSKPVILRVTMIDIHGVDIFGGGRVKSEQIDTDELAINLSGGSQADIETITTLILNANLSGGSQVTTSGQASELRLTMSGGGNFNVEDLETSTVSANLSGGANATLWINRTLSAELSGGSHIRYYGSAEITENLSGGSTVTSQGEHK